MRTIIAAYHDRGNAEQAASDVGSRFEDASLDIIDERTAGPRFMDSLAQLDVPRERCELYAEAARRGATVVVVRTPGDDAAGPIAETLDRQPTIDLERAGDRWRAEGWTGYRPEAGELHEEARRAERELLERDSFDVVEEEVRVGKREVRGGGVRVHTFVTERPFREDIRLREEHVAVTREPADEPVAEGATDTTFTEQEYVVTTTAEEPVVEKQARVVEHVKVEKEAETHTETIEDTERRREVEVEQLESERPRPRH